MQTSVRIMDIDVDMITNDVFIQKMNEYLMDDHLDVILFASTELLNHAVEDVSYHELIDRAELFLPGEEALLSAHHVEILEAGDMVVSCKSLGILLENLKKEDRTLYIIARNEERRQELQEYCKSMQPELRVVGSYAYDLEWEDAALINEINSHTPDMLLLDLETGVQEKWIMDHVPLLNARLCIAVGGVAELILSEQRIVPKWVRILHLEEIYQRLIKDQSVKKGFQARIFRKKVVQYNNQTEESQKDTEEKGTMS